MSFTYTFSNDVAHYLDLTLNGSSETGVTVPPFRKPTPVNSTLIAKSCHPPHVLKNILVGELIRLKRNCSNSKELKKVEQETLNRLASQGYPRWSLDRASNIVRSIPRKKLMVQRKQYNYDQESEQN